MPPDLARLCLLQLQVVQLDGVFEARGHHGSSLALQTGDVTEGSLHLIYLLKSLVSSFPPLFWNQVSFSEVIM